MGRDDGDGSVRVAEMGVASNPNPLGGEESVFSELRSNTGEG
jgi:hypothetical protein